MRIGTNRAETNRRVTGKRCRGRPALDPAGDLLSLPPAVLPEPPLMGTDRQGWQKLENPVLTFNDLDLRTPAADADLRCTVLVDNSLSNVIVGRATHYQPARHLPAIQAAHHLLHAELSA